MNKTSEGFSLLELVVGIAIITIGLSAALPSYLRSLRQGEVDRYTQQLEAGFFGLRAKLGQQKTSCTLTCGNHGLSNFVSPADLVEMRNHPRRIECCNSDIEAAGASSGCAFGPQIGMLLAKANDLTGEEKDKIIRDRSLRLLDRESTPESNAVEIAVNLPTYELTPPGTSTMSEALVFLIRSKNTNEQRLRTRCLEISGTGTVFRANWNSSTSSCEK